MTKAIGSKHSDTLSRALIDRMKYQFLRLERSEREIVVGIGLSRTGTTSLISALDTLGYKGFHYPPIIGFKEDDPFLKWPWWMARFNAISDIPCAILFTELYEKFPNAKFVLTVRDQTSWLNSCERLFTKERAINSEAQSRFSLGIKTHEFLFESHAFDRENYVNAYKNHQDKVMKFFSRSPEKLLVYKLTNGAGWPPLCQFLNRPLPVSNFPSSNKFSENEGARQ